jgi:autotransporter translocation and assembly factor TamB
MRLKHPHLLITLISALFILSVAGYLFLQSDFLLEKVRGIMLSQLRRQLDADVYIGPLSGNLLRYVVIGGLTVRERDGDRRPLISAGNVLVDYRLIELLRGKLVLSKLQLASAKVRIEVDRKGRINLVEIYRREPGAKPSKRIKLPSFLVSSLVIKDSTISIDDRMHGIKGEISGVTLLVKGKLVGRQYNGDLEIPRGYIAIGGKRRRLSGIRAKFKVQGADRLGFSSNPRLSLELFEMKLGRSDLQIKGEISDLRALAFRLNMDSEIHLDDLSPILTHIAPSSPVKQMTGRMSLSISAGGNPEELSGKIRLEGQNIQVAETKVERLDLKGGFTSESADLRLSLRLNGGGISGPIGLKLANDRPYIETKLRIENLNLPEIKGLSGRLDGEITLNGSSLGDVIANGRLQSKDFKLNGVDLSPMRLSFGLKRGDVVGHMELAGSVATLDGRIGDRGLNVELDISIISDRIAPIAAAIGLQDVTGSGEVELTVEGSLNSPRLNVKGRIEQLKFKGFPFGTAGFDLKGDLDKLNLSRLELSYKELRARIWGDIYELSTVDLQIQFDGAPIHDYAQVILPDADVVGYASGKGRIYGRTNVLDGVVDISVDGLTAYGLPFRPAQFKVLLQSGRTAIPELELMSSAGPVWATVEISPDGRTSINGKVGSMEVSRLLHAQGLPLPMTGEIMVTFEGRGDSGKPFNLLAEMSLKGMRYEGRSLGDMTVSLRAEGEDLEIDLEGFRGTTRGKVRFQPESGVSLDLELSDMDISPFLPSPFSGRVSVIAELAFREPSPWELNGSVTIRSLSISSPSGGMSTISESHLTFTSGIIGVDGFQMLQESGGQASISGSLARDSSDLSVSLNRFATEMLLPDLEGTLDMDLRLTGSLSSPRITLVLSSPGLKMAKYEGIHLSELELRSELREGMALIRQLKFDLPGGGASVSGTMPLELDLERAGIKLPDRKVDLRFEGGMISDALNGVISGLRFKGGSLGFSGGIEGTSSSPKLSLNLKLSDVGIEPRETPYLNALLEGEIGTSFDLRSGRIEVDVNCGALSDLLGGRIDVRGTLSAASLRPFEPTYSFDLICRSAELAPLIRQMASRPDLPLGMSMMDLKARIAGRGLRATEISADASFLARIKLSDEEMESISPIALRIREGKMELPSIELKGKNSALSLSGWVDLDGGFQISSAVQLPMGSISPFISEAERWGGTIELEFEGSGLLTSPAFKISCLIDRFTSGDVKFEPTISVQAEYSGSLFKVDELSVRWGEGEVVNGIRVSGGIPAEADLRSRRFKLLDQPLSLSVKGKLDDLSFLSSLSTSIVEIRGKSDFKLNLSGSPSKPLPKGEISFRADRLVLRELVKPIEPLSLEISAEPGSLEVKSLELSIGKGKISAGVIYSLDGVRPLRMNAHVGFQGIRIEDLKRIGYRSILSLAGEASGEASMETDISSLAPPWRIGKFGYLKGLLAGADGKLKVKGLRLLLNDQELRPKGEITGVLSGGVFDLRSFQMVSSPHTSGSASLAAMMLWEIGKALSIEASGQLDLSAFPSLLALGGSGRMHFGFSLKGTENEPTFELSWGSDDLTIKRARFSKISGRLRYASGKLLVARVTASIGSNLITATGYIPAKFELPYFRMSYPKEEMELSMDARITSLDFIPLIWQDVVSAQGQGNVSLTLGGTLSSPSLSGVAEFRSLSLQYLPSAIELKETGVTVVFNGQNLVIDRMSGLLNGGTYSVSGRIGFKGFRPEVMEINGSWNSSLFYRPSLYVLRCSGDVSLRGTFRLPVLTGTVTIEEFRYSQSWGEMLTRFLSPSPETRAIVIFDSPLLRGMELDLDVQAPGGVFVDAGIASVEVGFNGKIRGPLNRFVFVGESDIASGELVYLNHRFRIVEGHIENVDRFRFNPRYAIVAETERPIRGVTLRDVDGNLRVRDIDVTITLSGTLDQPAPPILSAKVLNAEPGEDYELDSEDIISILTTGRTGSFTFAQVGDLSYAAADIFRRRAESYLGGMVAGLLGFKEFEIEFAPSDIEETRLLFTKEFSPRWSLTYSSTLQLHSEPRIEVEYQISEHLAIIGERTEQGKYGIDLKLEYEFR